MAPRPIRRCTEMIGLLSRGKFEEKLDEHMNSALSTLETLPGEKGTATMTVTITFNFESGRLDIKPTVKSKLPEDKGFSGTPFWTYEGGLSVQHPSQFDMFAGPRDANARPEDRNAG